jgi:hypothetical protein
MKKLKYSTKGEKLIKAKIRLESTWSYTSKYTLKRKSEHVVTQDPDEETKEKTLHSIQAKYPSE